jgi:hypothetical protein
LSAGSKELAIEDEKFNSAKVARRDRRAFGIYL